MPGLLATLHPASGQSVEHYMTLGNGTHTPASAANLKDGSDATRAIADWYGDDFTEDEGHYREDWTLDACPTNATWVISSIKVRMRVGRVVHYGGGTFYAQARFGASGSVLDRGTESSFTGTAWKEFDFPTNLAAGAVAWTPAGINALQFGGKIRVDAADASSGLEAYLIELQVQVWGDILTQGTVAEMKGEALAAVATLITIGSLSSCIGEAITGHSAHGNTQGTVAEAVGEALEVDGPVTGPGPFVPVVTTLNLGVVRAAHPDPEVGGNLGDLDIGAGTATSRRIDILNPGVGGSASILAEAMEEPVGSGAIEYVVFNLYTYITSPTTQNEGTTVQQVVWTLGADSDAAPMLAHSGVSGSIALDHVAFVPNVAQWWPDGHRKTAPITSQPNGAPWTWEAIADLVDVGLTVDYDAFTILQLRVSEVWIEVYGTPSSPAGDPSIRIFTLPAREVGPEVEAATLATGKKLSKSIGGSATRKAVIRS